MTTAIRVTELTKRYGSVVAVDDLTLEIPEGAAFGLLGPNGAGKSTTFGVLCGWLRPTRGKASVFGVPSTHLHRFAGKVSALPQDASLPVACPIASSLHTYARLAGFSSREARAEVDRVLDLVGLRDAARKRGSELSHGMAKRAGIAAAFIGNPRVVFLDEPTAGLDPKNAKAVRDLVAAKPADQTIVVSSHNLAEVQDICTHGAILDRGRLTVSGTMASLTQSGARASFRVRGEHPAALRTIAKISEVDSAAQDGDRIVVSFAAETDPAVVVGHVLRVLLDSGVPILGVELGTSLEDAFLEMTSTPP